MSVVFGGTMAKDYEEYLDFDEEPQARTEHEKISAFGYQPVSKKSNLGTDETDPSIIQYSYKDGVKFEFVKCSICSSVLSSSHGGHWTRHLQRKCVPGMSTEKLMESQEVVRNAIANYCLESGESFHHTESDSFRRLLKTCMSTMKNSITTETIKLPCRQTIRDLVETKCIAIIHKIGEEISPYVKNGTATLVLDFGKHVNDFLSSFVSYISIDEHGEPFLKILPYSFTPMFDVKTAINVKDLLVQSGSKFGLMEHEVLSMHIVSDGASNLSSMGKRFFADWAICACHAIQKMSEKVLSPNVKNTFMYSSDELKKLNECSLLMGKCAKLALAVHKNKKLLHLSRLPTTYVETRWQSCINCAKDILSLLPFLKHSSVCMISEAAKEIEEEIVTLNPIVKTLEQFEPLLAFFEQSTVTVHLYLPMIQAMHNTFSQIEKETDDTTTRIINKSARIVTGEYLEKKISHLHLKATLLTPRLKKMSKMTQSHQQLHHGFFRAEIPIMPLTLAVFCCFLNMVVPGSGTFLAGISVCCCSDSRGSSKFRCLVVNTLAAILQFLLFPLLIGFIWSVIWGIMFIQIARNWFISDLHHRTDFLTWCPCSNW